MTDSRTTFEREYHWGSDSLTCANAYLLPALERLLDTQFDQARLRILDLGCGNGAVTAALASRGHHVLGVDASAAGIAIARRAHPDVRFEECSIYDDSLASVVGPGFDCVVSLEVIEHLHMPRRLMAVSRTVLNPDGILIVSTPYHGYLKNLALSVLNRWDEHFSVWWDGGHVKDRKSVV